MEAKSFALEKSTRSVNSGLMLRESKCQVEAEDPECIEGLKSGARPMGSKMVSSPNHDFRIVMVQTE